MAYLFRRQGVIGGDAHPGCKPAVHGDGLAINKIAVRGGQEMNHGSDLLGLGNPGQGNGFMFHTQLRLAFGGVGHGGVDRGGADHVDPDPSVAQLDGGGAGDSDHRPLGGHVGGQVSHALQPCSG